MQCRICLEDDRVDTMVAPCECTGTSKYIHLHCLKEYTRFYPTRICMVCKTHMHYRERFERVLNWIMIASICILFLASHSHIVPKLGIALSLALLISGFALHNCLSREVSLFVIAMCVLPTVVANDVMMVVVSNVLIAVGGVYTFVHYIPLEYTFVVAATLLVGLYMGVFVASMLSVLDMYAIFLTTLTLFFFWYGWIKLHPPLRLLVE